MTCPACGRRRYSRGELATLVRTSARLATDTAARAEGSGSAVELERAARDGLRVALAALATVLGEIEHTKECRDYRILPGTDRAALERLLSPESLRRAEAEQIRRKGNTAA